MFYVLHYNTFRVDQNGPSNNKYNNNKIFIIHKKKEKKIP